MLTKGAYNWVSKYLKYVVDMVENGEKMVKFYFIFLKNGEMVKNGDLNFKLFFSQWLFTQMLKTIYFHL